MWSRVDLGEIFGVVKGDVAFVEDLAGEDSGLRRLKLKLSMNLHLCYSLLSLGVVCGFVCLWF